MLVLRNIAAAASSLALALALMLAMLGSRPTFFLGALIAVAASIMGAYITIGKEVPRKESLMFAAPTVLSTLATLSVLLFVESSWMRLAVVIGIALLHAAYLTHLFFFLHVPTRYSPHALESVSSFLHLATIFSVGTAVFGFGLFTEIPFPFLLLPLLLTFGVILFQALWVAKIPAPRARLLAGIGAILLTQIAAAFAFLPSSLYVNGAALALAAYALHFHFRVLPNDPHFHQTARRATYLASSLFALLLISAPWR